MLSPGADRRRLGHGRQLNVAMGVGCNLHAFVDVPAQPFVPRQHQRTAHQSLEIYVAQSPLVRYGDGESRC